MSEDRRPLGVLGGMGPLASAEFLKTIYECSGAASARDQDAPHVILFSDPSFPDRTEAFLRGDDAPVRERLTAALESLCALGAGRIVVCCMTIHHLLPGLAAHLRGRVVSMLDVVFDEMEREPARRLLVCSTGTRRLKLFERHEGWARAKDDIVFPTDAEQAAVHELIYEVKRNRRIAEAADFLKRLMRKHEVDSFIAGCSEVHMLAKQFGDSEARARVCIDPLAIIARHVAERSIHGL